MKIAPEGKCQSSTSSPTLSPSWSSVCLVWMPSSPHCTELLLFGVGRGFETSSVTTGLRILITSVAMGIESVEASWVSLNLSTSTCSSVTWAVYDFSFQRTIGNKGFFFIGLLLGYLRTCTYSNHCKRQHIFVVNGSSGLRFCAGCLEWRNRRPVSTVFAA